MREKEVCLIIREGMLSELIANEVLKVLREEVRVCRLPNEIPKSPNTILVDVCSEGCARETAKRLGVEYQVYINLEEELGQSLHYGKSSPKVLDDVGLRAMRLIEIIRKVQQIPKYVQKDLKMIRVP
jgi:predicted AAA+ superfamily ATPase